MMAGETLTFKIMQLQVSNTISQARPYALSFRNEELPQFTIFQKFSSNVSNVLVSLSAKRGSLSILQNDVVRIQSLVINYRRHSCGGSYTLEYGLTLNYPDIDADYGQLECAWLLRGFYSNPTTIFANISFTDSCEREYIVIYAGVSPTFPEQTRLCRDTPLEQLNAGLLIKKVHTLIVYHSEDFKPKESYFQLRVEKTLNCGSESQVGSRGEMVEVEAKAYTNNKECTWEFLTSAGMQFTLTFKGRFFIEQSDNCSKDYLEVQRWKNGLWIPEARFCGRDVPPPLNISSTRMLLVFRTNENVTGDGFNAMVNANCLFTLNVTDQTQTLVSPRYQRPPLHCEYVFRTESKEMINVRIQDQDGLDYSCNQASFKVYKSHGETDQQTGQYCINVEARSNSYLRLVYEADVDRSFVIEYDLNTCGGNVTTATVLRSVQNEKGDQYLHNMNCAWYVTAPADHSIVVRFKQFELEQHRKCDYDYVAIYKGALIAEDKRLTKLCGTHEDIPPVMVDGNQAVITVVSDSSNAHKGFVASVYFTRNCNERIVLTEGNSPVTLQRRHTVNSSEELLCYYRVMAPSGYRIGVQLKDLTLNSSPCLNVNCTGCNYIEVVSLAKYCVNGRQDIKLLTNFQDGLLLFHAARDGQYSFEIELRLERSVCDGQNERDIIVPGNGSTTYPSNSHCKWTIQMTETTILEFKSFNLQNASQVTGECIDYVQVSSVYMSRKFCGYVPPGYQLYIPMSSDKSVDIVFHSDGETEGKGFHIAALTSTACNRTHTELSGNLRYFGIEGQTCIDEIRVPDDYVISIYIRHLYRQETNPKIFDIHTNRTILDQIDDSYMPIKRFTNSSALRIEITELKNDSTLIIHYIANNKTLSPGCGGQLYADEVFLPNPPYEDRNQSDCRWEITVPAPNKIFYSFFVFNMGSRSNCDLDFVETYDVQLDGSLKLLKHFCGEDSLSSYLSESNKMVLVAKKSSNFDGIGWTFMYTAMADKEPWKLDIDVFL